MKIAAVTKFKHGELFIALQKVGWTQGELADRCGLSVETINSICCLRRRPDIKKAIAIADAFSDVGIEIDVLEDWPKELQLSSTTNKVVQVSDIKTDRLLVTNTVKMLNEAQRNEPQITDEDSSNVREALSYLTERERKVLELRFGLTDGYCRTLDECAKQFRVGTERIRQNEAKALRKLRHPKLAKHIEGIFDAITGHNIHETHAIKA